MSLVGVISAMRVIRNIVGGTILSIVASAALSVPATAAVLFSDNFNAGASAAWGNEAGSWRSVGGSYDASVPDNNPITYTSVTTLPGLTDFRVQVDVNAVDDGGIWLRSSFNAGNISGVLLVTGGNNGNADTLYWHTVVNGAFSAPQATAFLPGLQGSDISLTIDVIGDDYTAFVDGNPVAATTLSTNLFTSGASGLYDFSPISGAAAPRGQTFDNFSISTFEIAEPLTGALLAVGFAGLIGTRRRMRD